MSHIFDALQRSEERDSAVDSSPPANATELLRRAEQKAVSKWETATRAKPAETPGGSRLESMLDSATGRQNGSQASTNSAVEVSPQETVADVFSQFQTLKVTVAAQDRLVCLTDTESLAAEAYRLLGVRLRNLRQKRPLKKLLITSTIPQEGKTLTAANLACVLAANGKRKVLLLDGDLRRPSLAKRFGMGNLKGLSEWLQGEGGRLPSIYQLEETGLWLLAAGSSSGNALELLQSAKLPALVDQLAEWFDWVIIDSPPVLPLADASVWMRMTDGILLVARQGITEKRQLQKGLEAIEQKKLIGALINSSTNATNGKYYYHYKQDTPQPKD
jgi:capsular exopolysaccharide synthesis family protein